MKVKDLKAMLKDMPDNHIIYVDGKELNAIQIRSPKELDANRGN